MVDEVVEDVVVRLREVLAGEARGRGGIAGFDGGQYLLVLGPDVPGLADHLEMQVHVAVGQATQCSISSIVRGRLARR